MIMARKKEALHLGHLTYYVTNIRFNIRSNRTRETLYVILKPMAMAESYNALEAPLACKLENPILLLGCLSNERNWRCLWDINE